MEVPEKFILLRRMWNGLKRNGMIITILEYKVIGISKKIGTNYGTDR